MSKLGMYLVETEAVDTTESAGMDALPRIDLVVAESADQALTQVVEHYDYKRQGVDTASVGRLGDYDPGIAGHAMVISCGRIIASKWLHPDGSAE